MNLNEDAYVMCGDWQEAWNREGEGERERGNAEANYKKTTMLMGTDLFEIGDWNACGFL